MIKQTSLTTLINSYQKTDHVLWQVLTAIANSNTEIITSFNQLRDAFNWHMRLEIVTPSVATNVLTSAHRVYLPRDSKNLLIYTKVKPQFVGVTAKGKPSGADFIGDIRFSRDAGVTTNSLFKTTTTLVLPDGARFIKYGEFAVDTWLDGDLISVNVSQTGSATGIEIFIIGAMS